MHELWQVSCNFTCYNKLQRNCNHEPQPKYREPGSLLTRSKQRQKTTCTSKPEPEFLNSISTWGLNLCGLGQLYPLHRDLLEQCNQCKAWYLLRERNHLHTVLTTVISRGKVHKLSLVSSDLLPPCPDHQERGRVQDRDSNDLLL